MTCWLLHFADAIIPLFFENEYFCKWVKVLNKYFLSVCDYYLARLYDLDSSGNLVTLNFPVGVWFCFFSGLVLMF